MSNDGAPPILAGRPLADAATLLAMDPFHSDILPELRRLSDPVPAASSDEDAIAMREHIERLVVEGRRAARRARRSLRG